MAQILGWLGDKPSEASVQARSAIERLDAAIAADRRLHRVSGIGLAAATQGHSDSLGGGTFGDVTVAFIGRPRYLQSPSLCPADPREIAERFESVGARVLEDLRGAFALSVFDARNRRGVLATDRMGICPLFYRIEGGGFAFGSAPSEVAVVAGVERRVRTQAIFDYLFCHVVPAPNSIFEHIDRLLPGECIEVEAGKVSRRRYWKAEFREHDRAPFDELKLGFIDALEAGVRDSMQGARCGAFLSGGTDSSTIVGLMTRLAGEPANTFSIGFEAEGFDEMEYARIAARHFGTHHHEYYVTPRDIVSAAPMIATAHPQPFGNSSALPTYFCARLARETGIERMLGGDGGDELFGGNARYAKQRVFTHYERLPVSLRSALIEPIAHALSRRGRIPLISKAVSYVEQACVPMPERLETYNLLNRIGHEQVMTGAVIAQVDAQEPLRLNRDAYYNPSAASLINRMLALDFKTTLADNDLPKVMQSCQLADVSVEFPMLDFRVVDFSLKLEPHLKLKGTRLRYFFKEALRGFLPEAVITKTKHGFGLPFGEWAVRDPELRALTYDSMNALKRRDLVRVDFIDRLKDELLPQHPNYYGTLAWILMALELWLQRHLDAAGDTSTLLREHVESA